MTKRDIYPDFHTNGKRKSFRRPNSRFERRGTSLSIGRSSLMQNSNTLVRHKQNAMIRSSVNNVSLDATETVEMVQSLIEKGRNLLKSVSVMEKSLQYEVEAEHRKELLRMEYIDKALENNDSKRYGNLREVISPIREHEDVSVYAQKNTENSSNDSIIILSDEDESEGETKQYSNSQNVREVSGVLCDESQQEQQEEDEEEEEEDEENEDDEEEGLLESDGEEEQLRSPSPVYSEHSNADENQLLSEYSDDEDYFKEEEISSDGEQLVSKPTTYMQQPNQPRLESSYSVKENSSDIDEISESISESYEEEIYTNDDNDDNDDTGDNSERLYDEQVDDEENTSKVGEIVNTSNIETSEEKYDHQADFTYDINSIAKQALDRINHHDFESYETMALEPEHINSQEEEFSHEQDQSSENNTSNIGEQYSEDSNERSYYDENLQNVRSDGVGELGEYSYHVNSGNNEYGLITDHDHSILTGQNEKERESDNLESGDVLDSSVASERECSNIQMDSNRTESYKEKHDSIQQENIEYKGNSPAKKKTKYSLSFSETYSDTDSKTSSTEEQRDGSTPEYHSAFSNNPFEDSEKDQEQGIILQNVLDSLGLSAITVNAEIEENKSGQDDIRDEKNDANDVAQKSEDSLPIISHVGFSDNGANETVSIVNAEDPETFKNILERHSPETIDSKDSEDIHLSDSDVNNDGKLLSDDNYKSDKKDITVKIPLFVDEETIRLTTSPVRTVPDSVRDETDSSIVHDMTNRIKLNKLSTTLEFDVHQQREFSITSTLSNNMQNPLDIGNSPENLKAALDNTGVEEGALSTTPESQAQLFNDIPTYDDIKDLQNQDKPFESSSVNDGKGIKIPQLIPSQEAAATQPYPFKVLKNAEKRTELSDYVNSIIHGQESSVSNIPVPIVTEPSERSISSNENKNTDIQVEEVVTDVPITDSVQKISTKPEVTLKSSPEIIHDAVMIEEVAFETKITENDSGLDSDNGVSEENEASEENETLDETAQNMSQSGHDTEVETTENNIINDALQIDNNYPDLLYAEIKHTDAHFSEGTSDADDALPQSDPSTLSAQPEKNDVTSETEQPTEVYDNIKDNVDNYIEGNSQVTSKNPEIYDQNKSTVANYSSSSRKSIARLIISSPLKIISSLANGLNSVSTAASEFVNTVNSVTVPYDYDNTDSGPLQNYEEESPAIEMDVTEDQQHPIINDREYNDAKSDISSREGENTEKLHLLEDDSTTNQDSELIDVNFNDNHNENNVTSTSSTKQNSVSNMNNEDHKLDSSDDVFFSEENNDNDELFNVESTTKSDSQSSDLENNKIDQRLKLTEPEDTVTIIAQEEPVKVSDIQVTVQEDLPKLERTPVKKRPRPTDSERKPSKKKRNKRKKQYRQRNSILRNLRPRSK